MRAALIPADPATPCRIVDLAAGDYRAMASAIGAEYIERVRTPVPSMVLGVDESGALKGLPENMRVSGYLYPSVFGDVLILSEDLTDDGIDFVDLADDHERFIRCYLDGWAE